jgi:filamentous hemagglutinin family protein
VTKRGPRIGVYKVKFASRVPFNVGKNTTANFDQSAGGSSESSRVALNRVRDPNALPSQILGRITAQGQVYVLNLNGALFGGSSQIKVGSLIVSLLAFRQRLEPRQKKRGPPCPHLKRRSMRPSAVRVSNLKSRSNDGNVTFVLQILYDIASQKKPA